MTLRQAMAQVGIYREDSALWSLVDQRRAWALAPPGRRELLRAASGVVDAAVERETIDAAARETPVRGCPKMPWFSEDRRCRDYRKPPPPMDERSFISVVMETAHPLPISEILWSSGMRTSVKKTSLKP